MTIEFLLEFSGNNFFCKENGSYFLFLFFYISFFITKKFFPSMDDYIDIPDICQFIKIKNNIFNFECNTQKKINI